MKWITAIAYAKKKGVTKQAVYDLIKRNRIKWRKGKVEVIQYEVEDNLDN